MDDDERIVAVAAGDATALRTLVGRHGRWLAGRLRTALPRADVEDVLQETFFAVWQGAGGYRPGGAVALADRLIEAGLIDEICLPPRLVAAGVGIYRVPVPARCHRGRDPLVPPLQPLVPRRRGTADRARCRSRPRDRVPVGPTVHAPCWPTRPGSLATHPVTAGMSMRPR
jgi:hypothetical protein